MAFRLIKYIFFTLLAMVLPSQASAYLSQTESDVLTRLSSTKPSQVLPGSIDFQALFDQSGETQTPSSTPSSHSEFDSAAVGIINANRWSWSSRHLEDGDVPSFDGSDINSVIAPAHRLYRADIDTPHYETDSQFSQSHRIAGWKETNALYVALNSQY